uniref:Uncharacterized protein n=1 Tax=viral metagenome TaxID=1070528 RepID=A0A6M3LFX1_9ZZZZ
MHRGFVKQWRKEPESDIWDMPPLAYKLWRYILIAADYKTGTLKRSCPQLAEALQWTENNAVVIPHRKTIRRHLALLEKAGSLVSVKTGTLSRTCYVITICNWATYQNGAGGLVPTNAEGLSHPMTAVQEVGSCSTPAVSGCSVAVQPSCPEPNNGSAPEKMGVKDKLKKLCDDHPWVLDLLKTKWLAHAKLPPSADSPSAKFKIADTILKLHTIDGYPITDVGRILEHAATVWFPRGMIGSPASLRDWTTKKDRKVHEAIWAQLDAAGSDDNSMAELLERIG